MASIDSLKASDGSGNAAVATIQSVRSAGATTLIVDTVQNINDNFYGTMGTPHTFVDPVTGEEITVISEATAVDFKGHVDGTNLEIDTIAPGFVDAGSSVNDIVIIKPTTQWADEVAEVLEVSHDDDGTLKDDTVETAAIKDLNVTTAKIADGAVTPAKLLAGTGTDWAWQSWTPTWTNLTVGSGTNEGYFTEVGKTVFYRLKFVYGSGSAVSHSPTFTLPKTIVTTNGYVSARDIIGEGTAQDASGSDYIVKARVASSTTALVILENTASTYATHASIASTTPMTWTTSDSLFLTGFYEKA